MIDTFIMGAISMGFIVASLFFYRFWKQTNDRLFLFFATSFLLLGINRVFLAMTADNEVKTYLYLVRVAAFVLILIGIADKNRPDKGVRGDEAPK